MHLIVNYKGEIVAAKVTTCNVHDTKPVEELAKGLTDKLYGYKGYLSNALKDNSFDKNVTLITTVRKNIKANALSFGVGQCCQSDSLSRLLTSNERIYLSLNTSVIAVLMVLRLN